MKKNIVETCYSSYLLISLENKFSPSFPSWERFYSNISGVLRVLSGHISNCLSISVWPVWLEFWKTSSRKKMLQLDFCLRPLWTSGLLLVLHCLSSFLIQFLGEFWLDYHGGSRLLLIYNYHFRLSSTGLPSMKYRAPLFWFGFLWIILPTLFTWWIFSSTSEQVE